MKLLEFVQKHPSHARGALYILTIGFAASFSALIVMGCAVHHSKTIEKDTNASLIVGDVLALQEAREAGRTEEGAVHRALIDARVAFCLSREDAMIFSDMLSGEDDRLTVLCDKLRAVAARERCTAHILSTAIRESISGGTYATQSTSDGGAVGEAYLPRRFLLFDTRKQAEAFFGVRFVFRTEGNVSYCENLYSRFEEKSGRLAAFSAEWNVDDDVTLPKDDCAGLAQIFAEQRIGIRKTVVENARFTDGVCWVDVADTQGYYWRIGVCGDTGRVCFYCPLSKTAD